MAKKRAVDSVPLEAIWEVPDEVWEHMEAMIAELYPPAKTGRPRTDLRKVMNGIIFRLRTGVQWNKLPKTFGDDSSVHRWYQRWVEDDVFEGLWATLINECEELAGVDWEWQSADCNMSKSRFSGEKRGETQRIEGNRGPRKAFSSMPRAVPSP